MNPKELKTWFDKLLSDTHSNAVDDLLSSWERDPTISHDDILLLKQIKAKGPNSFRLPRSLTSASEMAPAPVGYVPYKHFPDFHFSNNRQCSKNTFLHILQGYGFVF